MTNVKEVGRQVMYNEHEGMACGPCDILVVDAEIELNDNDKTVYLHGQWVSEGDGIYTEATTESTYEIYERLNRGEDDFDTLIAERDRRVEKSSIDHDEALARYGKYFEEIEKMIVDALNDRGVECSLTCDYDEEED